MADPNREDFYRRVDGLRRAARAGEGFEAAGALGRSFYGRERRRLRLPVTRFLALILIMVGVLTGLKAVMHASLGPATYAERLAVLQVGTPVERFGAAVFTPDPVTTTLSSALSRVLPRD